MAERGSEWRPTTCESNETRWARWRCPSTPIGARSTQRAVLNFPISQIRFAPEFIHILGRAKRAAARANASLDLLDGAVAQAIERAATEVVDGRLDDHFVVDLFQTGSGTSTNTNANEVIARRAVELSGGAVRVHPNDDVNKGQSSNDVIPTVSHLSAAVAIDRALIPRARPGAGDPRGQVG